MAPEAGSRSSRLDRDVMERLMFGVGRVRRFTQDTPILPDVWLEYAKGPGDAASRLTARTDPHDEHPPVKLLLTPLRESGAGELSRVLRERLPVERRSAAW